MQNQLLKDSDVMGMHHAIEIRVPFLDREFMETVLSIDPAVKFADMGKIPKPLLVKSFSQLLPRDIVYRKKQGFSFPFALWLKKLGKQWFLERVSQFSKKTWITIGNALRVVNYIGRNFGV